MGLESAFEAANLLGLSPIGSRALSSRPHPQDLALVVPEKLDDFPRPEGRYPLFDSPARQALARKLEDALAPLEPHVAVLDSVRALALPDATCIVAGQQPGLFGGPLFNTYKALHVAKLARALSKFWDKPVVPVLWNHADDHDIAEAHHAWFINQHVDLVKLHLAGTSSGRTPLSHITCTEGWHGLAALEEQLADLLAAEPFDAGTLQLAMPREGETLSRAWTRFHLDLFGHLGVVVLEPEWIRDELSESLAELVAPSPEAALQAGASRLRSAGFDVAIEPQTAALVYNLQADARHALRLGGDGWRFDHEPGSRTASELAAEIVCAKANYNAGALLRPLVQDMALPVSAYVGGWGELAYHAQLGELRQERGLDPGVFVPRASCTLTDARCRRSLRRLDQRVGEFIADARGPKANMAPSAKATDNQTADKLRALGSELRAALLQERDALDALDPALAPQLKRTANQTRNLIERLAKRVERVTSNHAGTGRRGRRRLEANLFPRAGPQERTITTTQLVARFGRDWIDELFQALDPIPLEHLVAHIDPHQ